MGGELAETVRARLKTAYLVETKNFLLKIL